jgi:hypothetical protein
LKKTSLGPLRQGQRLYTSEKKQSSSKERKPLKQSSNNHKELPPAHMQAPPEPMQLPPGRMHANQLKTGQLQQLQFILVRPVTITGQTGAQHVHRTSTLTGPTGDLYRSDRCSP